MRFENGRIVTDVKRRAKTDQSVKGLKTGHSPEEAAEIADRIIKNTYKVLMSRGMKGCFVYTTNKSLSSYFSKKIGNKD